MSVWGPGVEDRHPEWQRLDGQLGKALGGDCQQSCAIASTGIKKSVIPCKSWGMVGGTDGGTRQWLSIASQLQLQLSENGGNPCRSWGVVGWTDGWARHWVVTANKAAQLHAHLSENGVIPCGSWGLVGGTDGWTMLEMVIVRENA